MNAKEAKALVDSKAERDAEHNRSRGPRYLERAYDAIRRQASLGYTGTFVPEHPFVRTTLEAEGYTCQHFTSNEMVVRWEEPK